MVGLFLILTFGRCVLRRVKRGSTPGWSSGGRSSMVGRSISRARLCEKGGEPLEHPSVAKAVWHRHCLPPGLVRGVLTQCRSTLAIRAGYSDRTTASSTWRSRSSVSVMSSARVSRVLLLLVQARSLMSRSNSARSLSASDSIPAQQPFQHDCFTVLSATPLRARELARRWRPHVASEGVFRAVKADRRAAPINMNGPVDHALQAQRRPPSSHPQDAFEGNELAAVRGRPAAARQPDTLP
jgi:hypothetical protein